MPPQTQKKKKGGFGEKLKGVGKRIVQEAKKVPGTVYREGIKPEAKRILEKFTEAGPAATRPISGEPQAGTRTRPFEEGPSGLRQGSPEARARSRKALLPPAILESVSRPAPKKTIAEQVAPVSRPAAKDYGRAGGKTSSYRVGVGRRGAVARLNEQAAKTGRRPMGGGNLPIAVTTPKPLTDQTKTTDLVPKTPTPTPTPKKGRTKAKRTTRGSVARYEVKVDEKAPKAPTDRTLPSRKQRAGTEAARKKKAGKRKFSMKQTSKTLREAAKARQEGISKVEIDTTAQELARLATEQDIAREAQRTETTLKTGRKPTREKARYRYRTRGLKRSEGRGR